MIRKSTGSLLLMLALPTLAHAVEILRWERIPLAIPLTVGQERIVFVDRNVRVGVPRDLQGKLRVQSTAAHSTCSPTSRFLQRACAYRTRPMASRCSSISPPPKQRPTNSRASRSGSSPASQWLRIMASPGKPSHRQQRNRPSTQKHRRPCRAKRPSRGSDALCGADALCPASHGGTGGWRRSGARQATARPDHPAPSLPITATPWAPGGWTTTTSRR